MASGGGDRCMGYTFHLSKKITCLTPDLVGPLPTEGICRHARSGCRSASRFCPGPSRFSSPRSGTALFLLDLAAASRSLPSPAPRADGSSHSSLRDSARTPVRSCPSSAQIPPVAFRLTQGKNQIPHNGLRGPERPAGHTGLGPARPWSQGLCTCVFFSFLGILFLETSP